MTGCLVVQMGSGHCSPTGGGTRAVGASQPANLLLVKGLFWVRSRSGPLFEWTPLTIPFASRGGEPCDSTGLLRAQQQLCKE